MLIKNRFKEQYSLKQNIKYHFRRFKYGVTLYIKTLINPENELNLCRYEAFWIHSYKRQRYAKEYPYYYHLNEVVRIK